jgi:signal transduction histidine kinase
MFDASFVDALRAARREHPYGATLYRVPLDGRRGDRQKLLVNATEIPLQNLAGSVSVTGTILLLEDVTERVRLEEQLQISEKMASIGLLAAGVAHEVNTPLAVISSYAQMLAKQVQGDESKSNLLEKITRQTFRASEIVNNLLNFSRTSGAEFGDLDLNKVIHDTLTLLEHQFKVARITVDSELLPDLPLIHGNPGKMQQVFLNLFLNAKDAMPQGGTLRVRTSNGSGVNVTVSDTGVGIAQEHIRRIYDPFFTTKNSPNNGERRGTGLGLSVTYGIIQEHAGKIQVESRPGAGTTFYLEFPMVRKAIHA